MKVLLVANYEPLRQQSISRFAALLHEGLEAAGHAVRVVHPPPTLGRLFRRRAELAKWAGYIDRFLLYPSQLRRQARWADVVHICVDPIYIPRTLPMAAVFTCHDVLPIRAALGEIPDSPIRLTGRIYQRWGLACLKQAPLIACVSRQTRTEATRLTGLPDDHFAVVPNALNYPYAPMLSEQATAHLEQLGAGASVPFFMHVGGNQWYKNRAGVLRLFAELIKYPAYRTCRLLMAGKPWTSSMHGLAVELGLDGRVMERVDVSNEQLRALYSSAEALLFPSLAEGFGWPIVEAQACGCPVVTTGRLPMSDVGGVAAIYIDPSNLPDAARITVTALKSRDHWRSAGFENTTRFSVRAMIEGYERCYEKAIRKNSERLDAASAGARE